MLLQLFVGVVYAQLLQAVEVEVFKALKCPEDLKWKQMMETVQPFQFDGLYLDKLEQWPHG